MCVYFISTGPRSFLTNDAGRRCPNGKTLTDFGSEPFWSRPRFHRPPIHSFVVFQGDSKVNSEKRRKRLKRQSAPANSVFRLSSGWNKESERSSSKKKEKKRKKLCVCIFYFHGPTEFSDERCWTTLSEWKNSHRFFSDERC